MSGRISSSQAIEVIPTPQRYKAKSGAIPIAVKDVARLCVVLAKRATAKEKLAADFVSDRVGRLTKGHTMVCPYDKAMGGRGVFSVLLGSFNRRRPIDMKIRGLLNANAERMLTEGKNHEQGYVLWIQKNRALIMGGTDQGTLYGVMTLLQLFHKHGAAVSVPPVYIEDWPDTKYRSAGNWTYGEGRRHEGPGWCYDWGDGFENYMARVRGVLDRALEYKINMIQFTGEFYRSNDWQYDDKLYARQINQFARSRGIKLVHGGMGRVHNVANPNRVRIKNRKSYPDGPVYECVGYPADMVRRKSPRCRTSGLCRSNAYLNRRSARELKAYVKALEPGALYIHHEDLGVFKYAEASWRMRCNACRARWPNDALEAPDGGAAGYAHAYDKLAEAVFSVKHPETRYDAARDCLIIWTGPNYTYAKQNDKDWDKSKVLWANVYKAMRFRRNTCVCFREQFLREDDGRPRIRDAAEFFRKKGVNIGIWVYCANSHTGPILFDELPTVTRIFDGAAGICHCSSGHIFEEPLTALGAEYLWNNTSGGYYDREIFTLSADRAKARFGAHAQRKLWPPAIYGKRGFLERACTMLYGAKAGTHMKKVYALKGEVLCLGRLVRLCLLNRGFDWSAATRRTKIIRKHVEAALKCTDLKEDIREIVARFSKALQVGEQYGDIRQAYNAFLNSSKRSRNDALEISRSLARLARFVDRTFTFDWATDKGGDVKHWEEMITEMRREMLPHLGRRASEKTRKFRISDGIFEVDNPEI